MIRFFFKKEEVGMVTKTGLIFISIEYLNQNLIFQLIFTP